MQQKVAMMISGIGKIKPLSNQKKGFTLIELLCVIAIISMLFTISIPSISKTARNFYFTSKAKQIKYVLLYLKKTAILENRKYKFLINLEENSYAVLAESNASAGFAESNTSNTDYEIYEPILDSLLAEKNFASAFKFKTQTEYQQQVEIIFEPQGRISSQEFSLYDQNQHNATFKTTLSGQISLEFI